VRRVPPGAIDPTVKNLQWGDLTRGLLEARDRGAMYPILTDGDANLTEGSGFNVILIKDGKLHTPKKGVLEGVTRLSVLAVAEKLGYPLVDRRRPGGARL
jgi:branched-subunit amino acid aminotransferase/4-amino-4-deoxychorismate lyase